MNERINKSLSFLKHKELIQVCFGKYEVILNFSDGLSITVECPLTLFTGTEEIKWVPDELGQIPLNNLIGNRILTWDTNDQDGFSVFFDSKKSLTIHSNTSTEYENITICFEGEVYSL